MGSSVDTIAIDYDALARHVKAVDGIADRLTAAMEAGRSTAGLNSAAAFGLMCQGLNVLGTLASSATVQAMGETQSHLNRVTSAARNGIKDFQNFDDAVTSFSAQGIEAIDSAPGVSS